MCWKSISLKTRTFNFQDYNFSCTTCRLCKCGQAHFLFGFSCIISEVKRLDKMMPEGISVRGWFILTHESGVCLLNL